MIEEGTPIQLRDYGAGVWVAYKFETGKIGPVFLTWDNLHEFEEDRILSKEFPTAVAAQKFIDDFWAMWWRMSLS